MRHSRWAGSLVAGLAFAILLAGVMPASALGAPDDDDPAAEGKVTAYEAENSITVQVKEDEKKDFKVDSETKIEGKLAVGKEVMVWAKDGKATKIVVATQGKVTAYEAEKSITVEVSEDEKKDFKVDSETKIQGELAVGKEVNVWAKDGKATKIVVK